MVNKGKCSECDKPAHATGRCHRHYKIHKYGNNYNASANPRIDVDPETRFKSKFVVQDDGCWLWQDWLNAKGYGKFYVGRQGLAAHLWAYEHWVGPRDPNLTIDHLCNNTSCVNPKHMEQVTRAENVKRAWANRRTKAPEPKQGTGA